MTVIPDRPNFFSKIDTQLSCKQIAELYRAAGWRVRKCSWTDYEINNDWGELVVMSDSPVLLNGNVADIPARAEEVLAPLRGAAIKFTAGFYGPDPERELLLELCS